MTFCKKPRSELVPAADIATSAGYFATVKTYINYDPIDTIASATSGSIDINAIMTTAQPAIVGFGVFVAPFLIGLFLSLSLWSCLCCCCTCPGCCPSKCCQQAENVQYTKCEMAWPVVFLVTVLLLACAASVPGITRASSLADSINTMQCGVSLIIDDILNGNVSNDQTTFFLGANGLNNRLASLNGSTTNINNEFTTKLSPGIDSIAADYASAKDKLEKLGDGTTANSSFNLVYTVKPTAASANGMASAFNTVLGTPADPQSLNGVLYQIVGGLGTALDNAKGSIDDFNSNIGTVQTTITDTTNLISNFANSIGSIDNNIGSLFGNSAPLMDPLKLAFLGFYGAVIGLSVIALLGAIIMACFDKPGCRHLMYFSCLLIFIITILGFLLSFILSFVIPVMFLTCTTIDSTISTTAAFNNASAKLNLDPNTFGMISVCLPGGDGLILNKFGGAAVALNTHIQDIQKVIDTANNYSTYDTTQITNALTNVSNVIDDYIQAKRNDITYDPNTLNYFKSIASKSLFSGEAACTSDTNFMADTIVQNTAALDANEIPCSGATATSCTTFAGCAVNGCQSMYAIYNGGGGDTADVATRYPTCSVGSVLDYIKTNWHNVRTAVGGIPAIKNRYETVGSNPKGTIQNIVTTMTALKLNMSSVFSNLNTTINSVVDPTYGLFAGINCRTLGDDAILFKNTICVTLFNSLFFMFVTIGTSSFALLFSMCCIVCSGVRHYKQAEVKKKLGQSLNQDSSSYMVGTKY